MNYKTVMIVYNMMLLYHSHFFTKKHFNYLKHKDKYVSVMKQLRSFCVYNKSGQFICFQRECLLG